MTYELQAVLQTDTPLTSRAKFPALPSGVPGYQPLYTPVLAIEVPACNLLEVYALATLSGRLLVDYRNGKPVGAFCDVELRLCDSRPVPVLGDPPGSSIGPYSGEDVCHLSMHRPYWQPVRFGATEDCPGGWVALFVRPESTGCKAPDEIIVGSSTRYNWIMAKVYNRRAES